MQKRTPRCQYVFGAFAMAAAIMFSGCADVMVGPEDTAMNSRLVEATDGETLQQGYLNETADNDNVHARIAQRFSVPFPPPDSTNSGGTTGTPGGTTGGTNGGSGTGSN